MAEQHDRAVQAIQQKQQEYQQLVTAAHQEGSAGLILELQAKLAELHRRCKQAHLHPIWLIFKGQSQVMRFLSIEID